MLKILIYGIRGYIGNLLSQYLQKNSNIEILVSLYPKINSINQIEEDIKKLKPDRIVSAIGLTHKEGDKSTLFLNEDSYLVDNLECNMYLHLLISDVCLKYQIHYTYLGTGCIFSSTNPNYVFLEEEEPNFFGSKYGIIKGYTDKLLSLNKDKILIIRLRQCINNDSHPRNFLNKFLTLQKVSDISNSFTVVPSIFPILVKLIEVGRTGIFNGVNKNSISVKEIVEIFGKTDTEVADREFIRKTYANNILSIKNMEKYFKVDDIYDALIKLQ